MNFNTDQHARFVVSCLGMIIVMMISASLIIPKGDDVILINGAHHEISDRFFTLITYGGDGKIFIPLILILLFIRFGYAIIATSAWIGHGMLCSILKRVVFPDMMRPAGLIDHDLLYFVPGVEVHNNFSFPSGHTATAFCFAVLVSLLVRKKIIFFLAIALAMSIAWSRVYLLQHFVMDVAAGAFIGSSVAIVTWYLFETYGRAEWLNKRLEIQIKAGNRGRIPAR
jgi:membrane-associated phospholipid phosphatase